MVRSGGGIEWLILIYIYYTKIYVTLYNLKCIANFESQKFLQNSILWRSTCFYIVTLMQWNIVFIESCMYKSVFGKNKQITKKKVFIWRHVVYVPKSSTTFRGILICVIFRPRDMQEYYMLSGIFARDVGLYSLSVFYIAWADLQYTNV
jgi:hypothetical protein